MIRHITELTDDCIYIICKQLSFPDQLALTQAFQHFEDVVVNMIWRLEFRKYLTVFDERTKSLSFNDYQLFFKLIAPIVQELQIAIKTTSIFTSYLTIHTLRPEFDFYLSCHFPKVRIVKCIYSRMHNGHIKLLANKCPELAELEVQSPYITGDCMLGINKLKKLTANNCNLMPNNLLDILNTERLTDLCITGEIPVRFDEVLSQLTKNQNLRHLKVLQVLEIDFLTILEKFKRLETVAVSKMSTETLLSVLEKYAQRIKTIIWNSQNPFTFELEDAILKQQETLNKLTKIEMPYPREENVLFIHLLGIPNLRELHLFCSTIHQPTNLQSLVMQMIKYLHANRHQHSDKFILHLQYEHDMMISENANTSDFLQIVANVYVSSTYREQSILRMKHSCSYRRQGDAEKGFEFW